MTVTLFDTIAEAAGIDQRFAEFDREHPEIFRLFMAFARDVKAAGHRRYSSDAILHRCRWHCSVNMNRRGGEFKINDHFSSRYARKLMSEYPNEFTDFFETRKLKAGAA